MKDLKYDLFKFTYKRKRLVCAQCYFVNREMSLARCSYCTVKLLKGGDNIYETRVSSASTNVKVEIVVCLENTTNSVLCTAPDNSNRDNSTKIN